MRKQRIVDPAHEPKTGTAERGRLIHREMLFLAGFLREHGSLIRLELVELSPNFHSDVDGVVDSVDLGKLIVTSFLRKIFLFEVMSAHLYVVLVYACTILSCVACFFKDLACIILL